MKRYSITALILSLFAGLVFTACDSEDDENMTLSRDCVIKNIVLGTLKQHCVTKDSKGNDSTYTVEVSGAKYPMSIDQINGKVFNTDSLPKGTDISKVLFATLNTTGYTSIKSLTTGQDTLLNLKDTIDCSQPRLITVHTVDRAFSRTYTVEIRVHKEAPDSINWKDLTPSGTSALRNFADCRLLTAGKDLYVFGQLNDGNSQLIHTDLTSPDFSTASALQTAEGKALDIRSVRRLGSTFYALSEGQVYRTAQASEPWTATQSSMPHFDALVACSNDSLYALEGGKMYASADGAQWTASATDVADQWPTGNYASTLLQSADKPAESILLLAGSRDAVPVLWQHLFVKNSFYSYPWMFMPQTDELGDFSYPDISEASMMTYDNRPLLCGITKDTNQTVFYHSEDNGRTWKGLDVKHPLKGQAVSHITAAVDQDNFIWTLCSTTGQVFKGRHNRMGWLMR